MLSRSDWRLSQSVGSLIVANTFVSSAKLVMLLLTLDDISLIRTRKSTGPNTVPCSTPLMTLYKALVRSHFDYAMIIWNPHMVKHIESIEGVQRRATKMIPELKHLSYPERLKNLKLPTMAYRRARGDMIEVFKIVAQIYDNKTTDNV